MANVKTHVEAGKTRKGRKKKENWPRTVAHEQPEKEKAGTAHGNFETLQTLYLFIYLSHITRV